MRRLMWLAVGFGGACFCCAYFLGPGWMGALAAVFLAGGIGAGILGRERKPFAVTAYICLGVAVGLTWFLAFRQVYLLPAIRMDGAKAQVTMTASDFDEQASYGKRVEGYLELDGKTYRVVAYIDEEFSVSPGDTIQGTFRLRVTTPDSDKGATYHQGKGIFLLAYQNGGAEILREQKQTVREMPALLAEKIKAILKSCFPEDTVGFAQALLLGDTEGIDYETDTSLKVSGIRHIIAVSGLHVSIFYAMISTLTMKRRYLTALLGLPVMVLFAAVAGFTPSVVRACIMVSLMMVAGVFDREYDGPTALAFACLVMLVVNPLTITSVSFQLSVASVAGIFLFQGQIVGILEEKLLKGRKKGLISRLKKRVLSSVSVSVSAMSLTVPLSAWYFGTVSLVAVLTNLLALWAVSLAFYGIVAVCLVFLISATAAGVLGSVVSWLCRYVLLIARFCAGLPMAAVYTQSFYITVWLIFAYLLLGVHILYRKGKLRNLICCWVLGLCLSLLCAWAEPLTDECRVTVVDVGQGQSILLQTEGRTFLVDCGGDSETGTADRVYQTLLSQGVSRLDGIILTHYDADHAGGLTYLLTRIKTDMLIVPDLGENTRGLPLENPDGCITVLVDESRFFQVGQGKLSVFGPFYAADSNENSLCVLFETENCAILITGDRSAFGERMLLRMEEIPDVDLLIAGHHGSKYSTSRELLEAVRPETVIISVGDNSYGHPADEVLERLEEFGCTVYRTDENGTIIYRR